MASFIQGAPYWECRGRGTELKAEKAGQTGIPAQAAPKQRWRRKLWGRGWGSGRRGRSGTAGVEGGGDGVGVLLGDWQECSRDRHSVGSSQDGSGGNGRMVMRSKTEETRVSVEYLLFFFQMEGAIESRMRHGCIIFVHFTQILSQT